MKCKQCQKEIKQEGNKPKLFCSDKCRIAYNRQILSEQNGDKSLSEHSYPNNLTAKELYDAIDLYPNDTWKDSPEFIELKRRLDNWNLDKLKEEKFWIPLRLKNKNVKKEVKKVKGTEVKTS